MSEIVCNPANSPPEVDASKLPSIPKVTSPRHKKPGQALVEFALILPMLLLLLCGSVDFGWILFNYVSLYNGLREGVRYAVVGGYSSVPQYYQCDAIRSQIITRAIDSGLQPSDITVSYDNGDPNAVSLGSCPVGATGSTPLRNGYRVVIDLNVTVHFLTPFMNTFAPSGLAIHLKSGRSIFPVGF